MSRIPRPLLLAALVYVLFRVWVVMTAFDAVAIPVYEVPNMGNQAWLIADGWRGVPWSDYYDNAGGQLLTGGIDVIQRPGVVTAHDGDKGIIRLSHDPHRLSQIGQLLITSLFSHNFHHGRVVEKDGRVAAGTDN